MGFSLENPQAEHHLSSQFQRQPALYCYSNYVNGCIDYDILKNYIYPEVFSESYIRDESA